MFGQEGNVVGEFANLGGNSRNVSQFCIFAKVLVFCEIAAEVGRARNFIVAVSGFCFSLGPFGNGGVGFSGNGYSRNINSGFGCCIGGEAAQRGFALCEGDSGVLHGRVGFSRNIRSGDVIGVIFELANLGGNSSGLGHVHGGNITGRVGEVA